MQSRPRVHYHHHHHHRPARSFRMTIASPPLVIIECALVHLNATHRRTSSSQSRRSADLSTLRHSECSLPLDSQRNASIPLKTAAVLRFPFHDDFFSLVRIRFGGFAGAPRRDAERNRRSRRCAQLYLRSLSLMALHSLSASPFAVVGGKRFAAERRIPLQAHPSRR